MTLPQLVATDLDGTLVDSEGQLSVRTRDVLDRLDEAGVPLVVVTARLAKPVAPHQLPPMPTERELNHPGDLELFLMGWDGGGKPAPRSGASTAAAGGPSGARGFVR